MALTDPEAGPSRDERSGARAVFAAVFLPLVAVYALTAQWALPYHIDALTNAVSGWYIGNEQTVIAARHEALATEEQRSNLGWFVMSPEGTVGQYPPGAAMVAGLVYALAPSDEMTLRDIAGRREGASGATVPVPPLWPATLSAVLCTAAAAGVLALVLLGLLEDRPTAITAGLAFGLATAAWSVASAASWTHGPAMLAISLGLIGAQRGRWLASGGVFGFAILTRPHLALIVAALGIAVAAKRRDVRPLALLALGSVAGLGALLAYNQVIFHELTVSGGYSELIADSGLGWYLGNVVGALIDPGHGLLPWAPFLLVLVPGTVLARRHVPDWCTGSAIGGVLYLLVQLRANRFSGGDGHFGYRYPLEALTAAAPALALGYQHWVRHQPRAQRLLVAGLAVGLASQLTASVT